MASDGAAHELPLLYADWMGELLPSPIPKERTATCADCAMCVGPSGELPSSTYFFDPSIKCCVYMPELANFVVGRVLADERPELAHGRATVRDRLARGNAATPLGLARPATYELAYRNSALTIGRARSLRCPHYAEETGGCGLWDHRDSMCTTWFCRHDRADVGARFWRALRHLLDWTEGMLARHFALELGIAPEVVAPQLGGEGPRGGGRVPDASDLDGVPDPARRAALWGEWLGREEDYYRRCAELVAPLTWADVRAIGGPELEALARVTLRAHHLLTSPDLFPATLKVGSFQIVSQRDGGARAISYSALDAIDLPAALLAVLPSFDGRPTEVILRDLAARGIGLDRSYLRQLCDYGVLVSAD